MQLFAGAMALLFCHMGAAAKAPSLAPPLQVERHWASFWHEAELMSRLNHPNVLRFFGLVVEGALVVGIMTEFAKNGSLASYLRSGIGFIPLRLRAELALHAVHGMAYLHTQKVGAAGQVAGLRWWAGRPCERQAARPGC